MAPPLGTRWYHVHCPVCGYEHGFTAGALLVLVRKGMAGELSTVKGNAVCPVRAVEGHVPHSTDPRFDVAERVR